MQISIAAPSVDGPDFIVDKWVEEFRQIRDEGFPGVWIHQLPWQPDTLTLAALALREVDGIDLGTGVLAIQPQHPMYLAQRALTVNMISGGRLTLGLGLSHRMVTEDMWGIPWDRPLRRLNEYLDGLLPLLAGQGADAVGETVSTRGALQIPNVARPEVYIAALGPQMLRLAAQRSAGTVTWMAGPKTVAEHIGPTLHEAAARAGRPEDAVRVVAGLPVSVTDDVEQARAQTADELAIYGQLPSYRNVLDREGHAGPEDAALIGDEATVVQRLDELKAAGVDEFIAMPIYSSAEELSRCRQLLRRYGSRHV